MDILTHTLSGVAIGTVVAGFSKRGFWNKLGIIATSGIGGAIPDLDAISLWSKFDTTIGKLFGLAHSGKEIYFAKFWYSHHAFLHSAFAGLILAFIIGLVIHSIETRQKGNSIRCPITNFNTHSLALTSFLLGFFMHLLGDMPTPASTWGGVNFFWPSKAYIGGTGDIWWWNNYDLFLIAFGVVVLNILILLVSAILRKNSVGVTLFIFILAASMSFFQIKTRGFDFNYTGHTSNYYEYEQKSKAIQKHILGNTVYTHMLELDRKLSINF